MSASSSRDIMRELYNSKLGLAGMGILALLVAISISAVILVPLETFQNWNDPGSWLHLPKASAPAWTNWFLSSKMPEHLVLDEPAAGHAESGAIRVHGHSFFFPFEYDDFPNDFIYEFEAEYSGSPLLRLSATRPDGMSLDLLSVSLPFVEGTASHSGRIFSADAEMRKGLSAREDAFKFPIRDLPSEEILFSESSSKGVLKGEYLFTAEIYNVDADARLVSSTLVVGGKAFGVMGTDELRRDLAVGLLWGTPLALFIGILVAAGSVAMGLIYGVYAGYKGRFTDESMMRFNDVIYALPALPFLIILAVTISNNIFMIMIFLMIFGWVGVAKVSRSMALQIKTSGYVEASRMMGQKDSRVILKHVLPQLVPYAFASIAISVPAAITTEAGLSFLGLGDPAFPTWGQILHDANDHGATARGLWWWIAPPGLMIALTGLAFVFIGGALDAIVNPRLRR